VRERVADAVGADPAPKPALRIHRSEPFTARWASAVGNRAVQRLARAQRRLLARLTPQEILDQYQVNEDETIDWSPSVWGVIPIPGAPSHEMTRTEGRMLDALIRARGLLGLSDFKDIADQAFAEAERQFPDPATVPPYVPAGRQREWKGNDGHRDAFRHCYWNARLAAEYGNTWTRQFTTAHEALPANTAAREAMDLYNNEVGRAIAAAHPRADATELARLVRAAVDGGQTVVIDRAGSLAFSNTVGLWNHGLAASGSRAGVIAVPAGDASVND
jgi:hypothetical protein